MKSETPEAGRWIDPTVRVPCDGEEVLIWHVLGDQARSPHAFDVASYINGKWIFPWDRGGKNPPPQWIRYWMPLPSPPRSTAVSVRRGTQTEPQEK